MSTETLARCREFQVVAGCGIKCTISSEDISNLLVTWDANRRGSGNNVMEVQVAKETVDTLVDGGAPVIDTGKCQYLYSQGLSKTKIWVSERGP